MSTQPDLEVVVNGEPTRVPVGCTVSALLTRLEVGGRRIAVARNREVVPRSRFDRETLGEGDKLEILEAVGGG